MGQHGLSARRHGVYARAALAAAAGGLVLAVLPAAAGPSTAETTREVVRGAWELDTYVVRNGRHYTPSALSYRKGDAGDPRDDGALPADTVVAKSADGSPIPPVAPSGRAALRFPGPYDGNTANGVDVDASMIRIPHRSYFDPQGMRFAVSVYVRPRTQVGHDSPNIAQKGRVDQGNQHQWKVGVLDGLTTVCSFRGATSRTNATPTTTAAFGPVLQAGKPYRLDCELSVHGIAQLRVFLVQSGGGLQQVGPTRYGDPRPDIYVVPDDYVSVGKKPRDTSNGDAFAGDIDRLRITRWEP